MISPPYFSSRSILILSLLIFLIPNVSAVAVTNITQLTYGTDVREYGNPSWSPDGSKIAYISGSGHNYSIWVMNANGSNSVKLTDGMGVADRRPRWSPDGSKIVFERGDAIYIMNSDGSNQKMLIFAGGSFSISPDGKHITLGGALKSIGGTPEQGLGIFVMDIDGTNVKKLTDDFGDELMPSWSPDSKKIVFTKGGIDGIIHIMNTDGSNMISTGQRGIYARWSPDGKQIAFLSRRAGDMFRGMKLDHIYIMDIDGSNVTQLTFGDKRWDDLPDWSPDGTKIVFASAVPPMTPKSISNLYIMTLDFNATTPTPTLTATQTPAITQTSKVTPPTTATQTPGFSLLLALASLSILVLKNKRE